jgi:molecular chaperone HscA
MSKLLQISEPSKAKSTQVENEIAIGIDLGTTNSLVAFTDKDKTQIIKSKDGRRFLKSILNLKDGAIDVGENKDNNEFAISSIKRLMGKSLDDLEGINDNLDYQIISKQDSQAVFLKLSKDQDITVIEAAAKILEKLKHRAENFLKKKVQKAVITIPAYFDDAARIATKQAAVVAGLDVLRLINEPTAAALAYGVSQEAQGKYLIYDFGGGTFDVSILQMEKGIFKVIATRGDNFLGGDDLDRSLLNFFEQKIQKNISITARRELFNLAKFAKEDLTSNQEFVQKINLDGQEYKFSVTREEFEQIIAVHINRTMQIVEQILIDAKLAKDKINEVILVGGSTKIPLVRQRLQDFFARELLTNIDPDEVVAIGASMQAYNLTHPSDNILIDITPLSLGIELHGGLTETIINRNDIIPLSIEKKYTTSHDNQTGIKVHVIQGEREFAKDNRSLAFFELKGLPKMAAGEPQLIINFTIDMDGILTVSAFEEVSGKSQIVEVRPSYGLDRDEVMRVLKNSREHAEADMSARIAMQNQMQIKDNIANIEKLIKDFKEFYSKAEIDDLEKEIKKVRKIDGLSYKELDSLKSTTKKMLEKLVEKNMHIFTSSLEGKDIEKLNQSINKN